jgi:hypothetical protein
MLNKMDTVPVVVEHAISRKETVATGDRNRCLTVMVPRTLKEGVQHSDSIWHLPEFHFIITVTLL